MPDWSESDRGIDCNGLNPRDPREWNWLVLRDQYYRRRPDDPGQRYRSMALIINHYYQQRPYSSGDACEICGWPAADHEPDERAQVVNLLRKLAGKCQSSTSGYEAALNALGESLKIIFLVIVLSAAMRAQVCDHTLRWAPQGAVLSFRNGVLLDDSEIVLSGRQIAPVRFSDQDKMTYVYIREIDNPGQIPPSHYSAPIKETQVCSGSTALTAWWSFDIPTQAYNYTGPGCWRDVTKAPPPENCLVIAWSTRDLTTGALSQVGYLICDLNFYHGLDPNGDGCDRGSPLSDAGCTLDGTFTVFRESREDIQLKCS